MEMKKAAEGLRGSFRVIFSATNFFGNIFWRLSKSPSQIGQPFFLTEVTKIVGI